MYFIAVEFELNLWPYLAWSNRKLPQQVCDRCVLDPLVLKS